MTGTYLLNSSIHIGTCSGGYYLSIVDVIAVLTDQPTYQGARNYWKVLKHRLIKEGNETVTNCNRLKFEAPDGKMDLVKYLIQN